MIKNKANAKFADGTFWSFGLVNKKLAEIFFDRKNGKIKFTGHAFVKKNEYKTKHEIKWIEEETKRVKLAFRRGKYTWIDAGLELAGLP